MSGWLLFILGWLGVGLIVAYLFGRLARLGSATTGDEEHPLEQHGSRGHPNEAASPPPSPTSTSADHRSEVHSDGESSSRSNRWVH